MRKSNWLVLAGHDTSYDKINTTSDPLSSGAYPITGTANALLYTCYKNANSYRVIDGFFGWCYNSNLINLSNTGLLVAAGVSPLPTNWRKAIRDTFLTVALSGLNLEINAKGKGVCTASTITGG